MKKDFLSFLTQAEAVPKSLMERTQRDIQLSFRAKSIVTKFIFFQFLGAIFSLTVCPQFGLGLVKGHGIAHVFRMMGDWACAAFCGSLFLTSGMLVSFIGMKGEELSWVWRRYKLSLIFLPSLMWAGLMLFNMGLKLEGETLSYHLVWIMTAMLMESVLFQLRSSFYLKQTA